MPKRKVTPANDSSNERTYDSEDDYDEDYRAKRAKKRATVEEAVKRRVEKSMEKIVSRALDDLKEQEENERLVPIHFVGLRHEGEEEGQPPKLVHYCYHPWKEERIHSILQGFIVTSVRKADVPSSSSSSSSDEEKEKEWKDDWEKDYQRVNTSDLWDLFLECMDRGCYEDRPELSKEKIILFERVFGFNPREDLALKNAGELEELGDVFHEGPRYCNYRKPSRLVILGNL
jgi:hypothetical protein